jgi:TolB-like protein/Flp pilus assembly protein TadD
LIALLESPGRVVSREELQKRLWPDGTFVDYDQSLNKAVTKLRDALGDDPDKPLYVETIPKRGYRFIGPVEPQRGTEVGSSRRRWAAWGMGIGIACVAVASLWMLVANRPGQIASIAVLPLQALGSGRQQEQIADAMTEAIITGLAQVTAFRRVISHSSVAQFKTKPVPLPEVARRLRVDAVLEGSVLVSGDRLLVNVRLLQLPEERPLWSRTFERSAGEVLLVQAEVAREVARHARAELTAGEQSRFSKAAWVNPEAWRRVQEATALCQRWSDSDWDQGVRLLEEAVRIQPDYSGAYAALAACGVHLLNKGGRPPASACPDARENARKALELDPEDAQAMATRGFLRLMCEMDWRSADEDLERAARLAPHSSWVNQSRSMAFAAGGRSEESVESAARMLDIAPGSWFELLVSGFVRIYARRYEESLDFLRRASRADPGNVWPRLEMVFALTRLGRMEEAAKLYVQLRKEAPPREDIMRDVWVAEFEAMGGHEDDLKETIRFWEARRESASVASLKIAELYAGLKDADQTMLWLERAFQERSALLFWVNADPQFDFLRDDPRFVEFGRRAMFPSVERGAR